MNCCNLLDLGCVVSRFTWKGPKWDGRQRVFRRLYRAIVNSHWRLRYPNAHQHPFRFIAAWLDHERFPDLLLCSWKEDKNIVQNLQGLTPNLHV